MATHVVESNGEAPFHKSVSIKAFLVQLNLSY